MKIYGISTCDTCRKAKKAFPNAEFIDVRSDGLPKNVLSEALRCFESNLLNARSKTWRDLPENQRVGSPAELISAHPLLMKRPLIHCDDRLYLGWTKDVQASLGVYA
ncbi:MAG: ArsC/Spx/MgsR family protein [Paracoccaceae bacterium]|nr:ArsC/Spx/MgsR family protein [Paracoccaceae bacterium]MDG2257914.1 ArsC/Spx/MgsR family protein [Paracoccaceae bacterium]